jgi:hypothetical protein
MMSGQVDVVFIRKAMHRELDAHAVEVAALHDGISLSITSHTRSESDYMVDTLAVVANSAHAAIPVIDINPSPTMAKRFADGLARALCHSTRSTTDTPIQAVSGGGYRSAVVTVEATSGGIVSNDMDANGKRFTEIEAGLKWAAQAGARKPQTSVETRLRRLITEQGGIFAPGLGVVTEAEVKSMDFNPLGETSPDRSRVVT